MCWTSWFLPCPDPRRRAPNLGGADKRVDNLSMAVANIHTWLDWGLLGHGLRPTRRCEQIKTEKLIKLVTERTGRRSRSHLRRSGHPSGPFHQWGASCWTASIRGRLQGFGARWLGGPLPLPLPWVHTDATMAPCIESKHAQGTNERTKT